MADKFVVLDLAALLEFLSNIKPPPRKRKNKNEKKKEERSRLKMQET